MLNLTITIKHRLAVKKEYLSWKVGNKIIARIYEPIEFFQGIQQTKDFVFALLHDLSEKVGNVH